MELNMQRLWKLIFILLTFGMLAGSERLEDYPDMEVTLYQNNELAIHAPAPHKYGLGISRPDGTSGIIIDRNMSINPNQIRLFHKSGELVLNTASLKAGVFKNGRFHTAPAFTLPGLYCFHFSSNFETAIENSFFFLVGLEWPSNEPVKKAAFQEECLDRESQSF